jgi:hypothetical protein
LASSAEPALKPNQPTHSRAEPTMVNVRQTDRQTDRHTHTDTQTHTHAHTQTVSQTERQTQTHTHTWHTRAHTPLLFYLPLPFFEKAAHNIEVFIRFYQRHSQKSVSQYIYQKKSPHRGLFRTCTYRAGAVHKEPSAPHQICRANWWVSEWVNERRESVKFWKGSSLQHFLYKSHHTDFWDGAHLAAQTAPRAKPLTKQ